MLDGYERLRGTSDDLAGRFTALFERSLWGPFVEAGMPPDQLADLAAGLAHLGPLAERIVAVTLRRSLAASAARFLDEQAELLGRPPGDRSVQDRPASR